MERESRVQLGCALLTCLGMVTALCAAAIVLGLGLNVGARVAAVPSPAAVNRVALIGGDGNLYLVDRNGESKVAITTDAVLSRAAAVQRAYVFPNWSPDSLQLAFVGISSENNGKAALYTVRPDGAERVEIFSTGDSLPFYLYWSPDGKRVAFLIQTQDNDLTLNFANADGTGNTEVGKGSPFYFSWAPDSQSVVSHVGGSRRQSADAFIGVHSLDRRAAPQNLALAPANFLAPAWSPDGKEFLSAETSAANGSDELTVTDGRGEHPRAITRYTGSIYFTWSPDGKSIAYLLAAGSGAKTELHVARADGSDNRTVTDDAPLAFFWSPDGAKIAYLVRASSGQSSLHLTSTSDQQAQQRLTWKVLSLADRKITTLASFLPTDSFAGLLPYFDQYAQSVRLWSPDSTALVYSVVETNDTESVYVANVNGASEPKRISDGASAAWSWH